jgi:hypothetical protein
MVGPGDEILEESLQLTVVADRTKSAIVFAIIASILGAGECTGVGAPDLTACPARLDMSSITNSAISGEYLSSPPLHITNGS